MEGLGEDVLELEHMLAVPSSSHSNNNNNNSIGLNLEAAQDFVRVTHQHQHDIGDHHHQLHTANINYSTISSSFASTSAGITSIGDSMLMRGMLYSTPPLGQLHALYVPTTVPSLPLPHQLQAAPTRPRVRARRGQATDPHSIAERLRRERIAERMKALQELVPTANKTDRAAMLDEIVEYVKFLRLQVKVLSMSRVGASDAFDQLVADVSLSALEGEDIKGGTDQQVWSNDGIEQEVAKLMEQDVGAAMQFLQKKALCIMPMSLASAILGTPQSEEAPSFFMPQSNSHIHRA